MSTVGHKLFFLEQLYVSRKCALLSRKLCLGTIHKRRRLFFWIFYPPPCPLTVFSAICLQFWTFLTPSPFPIADVVYGRPLRVSSVCTIFLSLCVPFSKPSLCTHFGLTHIFSLYKKSTSNYYSRSLVLWKGTCTSKAHKPVTLSWNPTFTKV